MISNYALRTASILALVLALAAPAGAASTPEATEWLEKLVQMYERGPFRVSFTANIDMSGMGQPISGALKGTVTQKDRTHSRTEMSMEMGGIPGLNDGPITMSMLSVSDGTTVWTEMNNPALGGRQVAKLALTDLDEVAKAMGGMSPTSMDPVAQLEALTSTMDFEVVERGAGTVTLRGRITDATREKVGMLATSGVDSFLFVVDEKTGFPKEVRADGEVAFMTIHFSDLEFLSSVPQETFQYTPPEGVPVMDMAAMLPQQTGQ